MSISVCACVYVCVCVCVQVSDKLMEVNADAYLTQKLAAAWLAMRLDLLVLVVLTGCGTCYDTSLRHTCMQCTAQYLYAFDNVHVSN